MMVAPKDTRAAGRGTLKPARATHRTVMRHDAMGEVQSRGRERDRIHIGESRLGHTLLPRPLCMAGRRVMPIEDFHLEEFKQLKDEIKSHREAQFALQRNVLIAVAAVYVAAATLEAQEIDPGLQPLGWVIWWAPPVVVAFAWAQTSISYAIIGLIARYITNKIEFNFALDHEGWEHFYADATPRPRILRYNLHRAFFVVLLIATGTIAVYITHWHKP
jgi:hypothetical protein